MSVPDRASPRSDAMPTTRGTNFYLADPNLEFVCATRPVADALYHALAGALRLAEGQTLQRVRQSARELLVAALYVKRWLRPPPAPASVLTARECEWLDAIVDWAPIPAEALAAVTGGPS
jgi:hypothetical protein